MKNIALLIVVLIEQVLCENKVNLTSKSSANSCGEVFLEEEFILQSQDYPKQYPSNFSCYFLLKSHGCASKYTFKFLDFDLESSLGCTKDRLEIGKQDALCGNKTGEKSYMLEGGVLRLVFKTGSSGHGRGFKMLVKKEPCVVESRGATTEVQYEWTSPLPQQPSIFRGQQCCQPAYNSRKFILISPNFPLSVNKRTECAYTIKKASQNVCRLRLQFNFFFLGPANFDSCPYGHLAIDGKRICGCNNNLNLRTTFDGSGEKIIIFKSNGRSINSYTGFVLEVIQDECPKRYLPDDSGESESIVVENADKFKFYNDQENRVKFPQKHNKRSVDLANLVKESSSQLGNIMRYFYFFAAPDDNDDDSSSFVSTREKEETTYLETTEMNAVQTNYYNYNECLKWNQQQFNLLTTRYGNSLGTCKRADVEVAQTHTNCIELGKKWGIFTSPGYPFYYPGDLNVCYRFRAIPGYCDIRLTFADFLIEKSQDCKNDYVMLTNGNKYCGGYLAGKTLHFRNGVNHPMGLSFVTDRFNCRRGFKAYYEQISCRRVYPDVPTEAHYPETSTEPSVPEEPPPQYVSGRRFQCGSTVMDKDFVLEAYTKDTECRFKLKPYSQEACKIKLLFERFDLKCTIESLVIDGTMYCGRLNGRTVTTNIGQEQEIFYRNLGSSEVNGQRFRIIGHQIGGNCGNWTPSAQRLLELAAPKINSTRVFNLHRNTKKMLSKLLIKNSNFKYKDICHTLKTVPDEDATEALCQILKTTYNVTECYELPENSAEVQQSIERRTDGVLREIDCDIY